MTAVGDVIGDVSGDGSPEDSAFVTDEQIIQ